MSIKVLVADDSITIQKVIGIIFGGDEYSLTIVDNGKTAVDKAREINPDILLIDALMPGMTGYEVAEEIRSTPLLASKPILILTGSFEPFDEEKAKKCGADDFISKPFESQQIITKVKELLELGNSRAQSTQFSQPEPASGIVHEQSPEVMVPIFDDTPPPSSVKQPDILQQAAPADIWGAFTPEMEQPINSAEIPTDTSFSTATAAPDVFAIVTEENDAQIIQASTADIAPPNHTGSQWIPVEENTFEFEEEGISSPLQTTLAEQSIPVPESTTGEIAFEDEVPTPPAPSFSALPAPEPSEFSSISRTLDPTLGLKSDSMTPETSSPSVTLTEEQLKAALSIAAKDVIERIVWEIVPDLAEVLIREAINKIKKGE
ncbi:MAG: response regulator [Desulfuromonadaceae bacterium]|nr:response regulator [Desulfuromonadaceae bacterium]